MMFHQRLIGKRMVALGLVALGVLLLPARPARADFSDPWVLFVQGKNVAAGEAAAALGGPLGAWFVAAAAHADGNDTGVGADAVAITAQAMADGKFGAALAPLDSLAAAWEGIDPVAANFFRLQQGRALIETGAIAAADSVLSVGITAARALSRPVQENFGLYQRGRARLRMRQIDPPREDLEAALALAQSNELPRWAGDAALARSVVDRLQMDLEGARVWRRRALDYYRAAQDEAGQARAQHYLSVLDLMEGKLARGVAGLGRALDLARESGDPRVEGAVLGDLAGANYLLGDFEAALDQYGEAIRLVVNPWRQGMMLSNIGSIHEYRQEYAQAREVLPRARALIHQAGDGRSEAQVLLSLGEVMCEMKDFDAGLAVLDTALTLARTFNVPATEAWILKVRGHGLLDKGDLEGAAEALAGAVTLARQVGYFEILEWSLLGQAMVARRQGRLEDTLTSLQEALAEVDAVRRRSSESSDVAGRVTSQAVGIYAETIDVMAALNRQDPARGLDRTAFAVNQEAKGRVFLNLLAEAEYDLNVSAMPGYRQQESALLSRLAELDTALRQAADTGAPADTLQALEARRASVDNSLSALEAELRRKDPRYAEVLYPDPVTLSDLQARVLQPGELLLDYALGDSASYLWAVSRDDFRMVALPDRTALTAQAEAVLPLLEDYNLTGGDPAWYIGPAHALYRSLLAPVADLVTRADRLIVSPDGILHYVPFGALVTAGYAGEGWSSVAFLVRDKIISETPSASVLQRVRARPKLPGRSPWLLAGAPRRVAAGEADVFAHAAGVEDLPPLPRAAQELTRLAGLAPEGSPVLQGASATVPAFITAAGSGPYAVIHLATHGLYNERHPRYSGLVFSPSEGASAFLSVADVFGLDLDCGQVVLSACTTGRGRQVSGEGVVGLVRSFLFAGARSVIATLWNVSDEASARLMTQYYAALPQAHGDGALALARAQRALLAPGVELLEGDLDPAFPGFWAAYVLSGDASRAP